MRNPRYKIRFAYVLPLTEQIIFGELDEKVCSFGEVDFLFRILSPLNYVDNITTIRNMRRGGQLDFIFDETVNGNTMKKVIRISRN